MTLLSQLSDRFGDAFVSLGLDRAFGEVGVSQRPELAQFQCNGALPAAKPAGKNPRQLAEEVIGAIGDTAAFADLSIAGPGFINITLTDEYLAEHVDGISGDDRVGVPEVEPKKIVVDYGGRPSSGRAQNGRSAFWATMWSAMCISATGERPWGS